MASRGLSRLTIHALAGTVFVAAYAGVFACSSEPTTRYIDEPDPDAKDGGFDATPAADSGLGILTFRPDKAFSGIDGTHTFIVPLAVYDSADDLKVTADDPSAVDIAPKSLAKPVNADGVTDNGKYFFVTVKKAGTIKLTAASGGKTAQAEVTVTDYAADRWATGETRYKNGGMGDPPCTDCHVNGQAVDHSPSALATSSDEKVGAIMTTGISPAGFPIQINGKPGHQWKVSDVERAGLVTYLRALEPRGFK